MVDRVNLVWLLRYRFAYNLSPAQAYYLLIPASHRLLPQQMQQPGAVRELHGRHEQLVRSIR